VWLSLMEKSRKNLEFVQPIVTKILGVLQEPNAWFYLLSDMKRTWDKRTDAMKNYVNSSHDFERQATEAEVLGGLLGSYFYNGGLLFGQVRRAALESGMNSEEIKILEDKTRECSQFISSETDWKVLSIKKLVQLQLGILFETVNAISRNQIEK
ncbi:MAG: hypothetical protein AABW93_00005, partial [Nanoarchaeota archaeon]